MSHPLHIAIIFLSVFISTTVYSMPLTIPLDPISASSGAFTVIPLASKYKEPKLGLGKVQEGVHHRTFIKINPIYYIAHIPSAEVLVEGIRIIKHIFHSCHIAHIPSAEVLVEVVLHKTYTP